MMRQAEELLTLDRWDGEISSVEIEVRKKSRYNSILSSALSSGFREYGSWDGIFKQDIKKKMTLYVNSREDKETKNTIYRFSLSISRVQVDGVSYD